jgi:hypothetical protein
MGELSIMALKAVQNLETGEDFDVIRDFLLTDPLKITHEIAFWRNELPNASAEEKLIAEEMINTLKNQLVKQVRFTNSVYSLNDTVEAKNEGTVEKTAKVEQTPKAETSEKVDPSVAHLHVVKDTVATTGDDKELREKYKDLIKEINVEALKLKVTKMIDDKDEAGAKEVAYFILGKGLYKAKKAKQWSTDAMDKWFESCKPAPATEEVADETDLNVKYSGFLGEHLTTIAGLKAECKFCISDNQVDRGLELVTFLLSNGYYSPDEGEAFKWSNSQIEDFIKAVRDDIVANPLTLTPSDEVKAATDVVPDTKGDAGINPNPPATEEVATVKMVDFYKGLEQKILTEDVTEESIKAYVLESAKTTKIENLESFYNADSSVEGLEAMYATFFISVVADKLKTKTLKETDVKEEIIKLVGVAVTNKEKGLAKVIQTAKRLYEKRGEHPTLTECKGIVYAITEEAYPEYYKDMIKILGEQEKPIIVQDGEDFTKKHPEIWEEVKNAEYLDDVYTMAREQEKKQDFLVVSEMITHLINSGKIKSSKEKPLPLKWGKAEIELWINNTFKNAETVAEAEKANTPDPTGVVASKETTDAGKPSTESPVDTLPGPVEAVAQSDSVASVTDDTANADIDTGAPVNTAVEDAVAIEVTYPDGITIPEGDAEFKGLYAKKNDAFWQEFKSILKKLLAEGKTCKEARDIMADKVKAIANNDDFTQCNIRNFKKDNITELYKMINKKAEKLGIEGWKIE